MAVREIRIYIDSTRYEVEASLFSGDFEDDEAALLRVGVDAPEPERTEIKTVGTLRIDGGRAEISYDETEVTGMGGSRTAVSFDMKEPKVVTMMRSGPVSTALVFEKGKRHHCVYSTPYMPFEVCVRTLDVNNSIADKGILELDYIVEIRGARAERTKFYMRIMD